MECFEQKDYSGINDVKNYKKAYGNAIRALDSLYNLRYELPRPFGVEIEKALDIIEKENIKLRDGDYFK